MFAKINEYLYWIFEGFQVHELKKNLFFTFSDALVAMETGNIYKEMTGDKVEGKTQWLSELPKLMPWGKWQIHWSPSPLLVRATTYILSV